MRLVVEGRAAPGGLRASPASVAAQLPNNRMLHLRAVVALEASGGRRGGGGKSCERQEEPRALDVTQ
jgi:hypothetical protein